MSKIDINSFIPELLPIEKSYHQQLNEIKEELKITRKERDEFKRKFKEASALDKNLLKNIFEKLIREIEIK